MPERSTNSFRRKRHIKIQPSVPIDVKTRSSKHMLLYNALKILNRIDPSTRTTATTSEGDTDRATTINDRGSETAIEDSVKISNRMDSSTTTPAAVCKGDIVEETTMKGWDTGLGNLLKQMCLLDSLDQPARSHIMTLGAGIHNFDMSEISTLDELYEKLFGDKRKTPARAEYVEASLGLGEVFTMGWNGPRHRINNGVDNVSDTEDYHAWCVNCKGEVLDYPFEQIVSDHKTRNIIRRPWDIALASKIFPKLEIIHEKWLESQALNQKQLLRLIHKNKFPKDHCYHRARVIRDSDPEEYALVIGSLGFIQDDGTTYWDCG